MPTVAETRAVLLHLLDILDEAAAESPGTDPPLCTPKSLPDHLQIRAAQTARAQNPANAAHIPAGAGLILEPQRIAVLTSKYWGPALRRLQVSFLDRSVPSELRERILSHMNAWHCGLTFVQVPRYGQVRISLGPGGYWSYVGTDILHIGDEFPTMNLQNFSMETPESEFKRVIRHEAGHTLAFPHEHLRREIVARLDRQKTYDYFRSVYGWPPATVDAQVLTPLEEFSMYGTPTDQTSVMCYQLPGFITVDGTPILGGTDINLIDRQFAGRIYPLGEPGAVPLWPTLSTTAHAGQTVGLTDWQTVRLADASAEEKEGEFVEEPGKVD